MEVKREWPYDTAFYSDDYALRFLQVCNYEAFGSLCSIQHRDEIFTEYCKSKLTMNNLGNGLTVASKASRTMKIQDNNTQ